MGLEALRQSEVTAATAAPDAMAGEPVVAGKEQLLAWRREFQRLTGVNPADGEQVKAWQAAHGVPPTGLVRQLTIRAARESAGRSAPVGAASSSPSTPATPQAGGDDPFKVEQGQLTFDAEGAEGGRYHTRTAHWPGGNSGVTIGRGYDLGQHGHAVIVEDLTAAGIAEDAAEQFAGAAGLKSSEAKAWLAAHKSSLVEITPEQQQALFETSYEEHLQDVERISRNYAKTKSKESGRDQAEFSIDFSALDPAILDLLVDLRYRGDYTPATRKYVQPLAIANDLAGLAAVMADKDKWKSVPADRFERRKNYMAAALARQKAGIPANGVGSGGATGTQSAGASRATPTGKSSSSTSAVGKPKGQPTGTATLKTRVNVRKVPSMGGAILHTEPAGTTFPVYANTGSWYQIEYRGGVAYVTTIAEYVGYQPAPKPAATASTGQPARSTGSATPPAASGLSLSGLWEAVTSAASDAFDQLVAWWEGDAEDQKQAEGGEHGAKQATTASSRGAPHAQTASSAGAGTTSQTAASQIPSKANAQTAAQTQASSQGAPTVDTAGYLFKESFEIVDSNALLRDANHQKTGKLIAAGARVYVVKADKTYVQIVTAPGAAEVITQADNVWTSFGNLGGHGKDVALGNEKTDDQAKVKADALRGGLPAGRNPGKSPYKWQFSGYFQPSLDGKDLKASLMSKVWRLMQWAIENDMVTSDIIIGDGVRSPKRAHQMCVAWNIQYGSGVTFDAVKKLAGGKDLDGNVWYQDGWTWEKVKENAKKVRSSTAIAAAGYEHGDAHRAPLAINSGQGVSRHCTGRAVDVTIPWRAEGQDASKNKTDVWGWESIYNQFGLHRALPRTSKHPENWHIEEDGKTVLADDEEELI